MPRQTLKQLSFDYYGLPSLENAKGPGYYWDAKSQRVVALKLCDVKDGLPILNPIAWIEKETLDQLGLQGFIEWEAKLWG